MNINENIRNERNFVEKLRGELTKLPISQLLTILQYQSSLLFQWLDIVLIPCGRIKKISNLNIHDFL